MIELKLRSERNWIVDQDYSCYCNNLHIPLNVIYRRACSSDLRYPLYVLCHSQPDEHYFLFCFVSAYISHAHSFRCMCIYVCSMFECVCVCVSPCVCTCRGVYVCVSAGDALTIPTPYSASVSSASGAAYIRTGQK